MNDLYFLDLSFDVDFDKVLTTATSLISSRISISSSIYDEAAERAYLNSLSRDEIVKQIEDAACEYVGLDTNYLEPMQVAVYEKGQKFNPHYDFFSPDSNDISVRGNRTKTLLVYLNDVEPENGGATVFPKLNLKIQPKAFSAIYFENMIGSEVDYNTLHAGEELKTDKHKKYAINIWFREKPTW